MNDVLNLVPAAQVHALGTHLVTCLWRAALAVASAAATTATVIAAVFAFTFATFGFAAVVFIGLVAIVEVGFFALRYINGVNAVVGFDFDQVSNVVFALCRALHDVCRFVAFFFFLLTQGGFFCRSFGFFSQQPFTVLARNLIIVWVNFGKSQKSVTVAAIIDKGRLKRRFDSGYFREVDVAFELLVLS